MSGNVFCHTLPKASLLSFKSFLLLSRFLSTLPGVLLPQPLSRYPGGLGQHPGFTHLARSSQQRPSNSFFQSNSPWETNNQFVALSLRRPQRGGDGLCYNFALAMRTLLRTVNPHIPSQCCHSLAEQLCVLCLQPPESPFPPALTLREQLAFPALWGESNSLTIKWKEHKFYWETEASFQMHGPCCFGVFLLLKGSWCSLIATYQLPWTLTAPSSAEISSCFFWILAPVWGLPEQVFLQGLSIQIKLKFTEISPVVFLLFSALSLYLLSMPANVTSCSELALSHALGQPGNPSSKGASYPPLWMMMSSPACPAHALPPCPPHPVGTGQNLPEGVTVGSWDHPMVPASCCLLLPELVLASHPSPPRVLASSAADREWQGATKLSWHEESGRAHSLNTKYPQDHQTELTGARLKASKKRVCSLYNRLFDSEAPC